MVAHDKWQASRPEATLKPFQGRPNPRSAASLFHILPGLSAVHVSGSPLPLPLPLAVGPFWSYGLSFKVATCCCNLLAGWFSLLFRCQVQYVPKVCSLTPALPQREEGEKDRTHRTETKLVPAGHDVGLRGGHCTVCTARWVDYLGYVRSSPVRTVLYLCVCVWCVWRTEYLCVCLCV